MRFAEYAAKIEAFGERMAQDAEQMDADTRCLAVWYDRFAAENLHVGWSERQPLSGREFCDILAVLGGVSAAFGFVVLQQFVANLSLAERVSGPVWPRVGVAFGHLRSPNAPTPRFHAGIADGPIPWMTGAGLFPQVVLGVRNDAGEEMYALAEAHNRPAFAYDSPCR